MSSVKTPPSKSSQLTMWLCWYDSFEHGTETYRVHSTKEGALEDVRCRCFIHYHPEDLESSDSKGNLKGSYQIPTEPIYETSHKAIWTLNDDRIWTLDDDRIWIEEVTRPYVKMMAEGLIGHMNQCDRDQLGKWLEDN